MGSIATFLLSLMPELFALAEDLFASTGGDVKKAQKLIQGSREHYRSKHAALVNRLDKLERDVSDD